MLFKTNTKGHKHPSIRLFIIEQDTKGKRLVDADSSMFQNLSISPDISSQNSNLYMIMN